MGDGKKVSLVLGSGGARGLAHIGVIRWLEERDYQIVSISGCSMGALVGGVYAAGRLDEFERWVRAITKLDIVSLLDIAWSRSGLVRGDRIIDTLVELVGDQQIEDLSIHFTAVASDVKRQREVWLQEGSLFEAIRASISIPFLFTPMTINGVELVDGGVLNPVPMAPTFSQHSDIVIAVDASGQIDRNPESTATEEQPAADQEEGIRIQMKQFIDQLRSNIGSGGEQKWDAYDIVHDSFDAMQSAIARQQLGIYPPDRLVNIPRNLSTILEFHRADALIAFGYQETDQAMS